MEPHDNGLYEEAFEGDDKEEESLVVAGSGSMSRRGRPNNLSQLRQQTQNLFTEFNTARQETVTSRRQQRQQQQQQHGGLLVAPNLVVAKKKNTIAAKEEEEEDGLPPFPVSMELPLSQMSQTVDDNNENIPTTTAVAEQKRTQDTVAAEMVATDKSVIRADGEGARFGDENNRSAATERISGQGSGGGGYASPRRCHWLTFPYSIMGVPCVDLNTIWELCQDLKPMEPFWGTMDVGSTLYSCHGGPRSGTTMHLK